MVPLRGQHNNFLCVYISSHLVAIMGCDSILNLWERSLSYHVIFVYITRVLLTIILILLLYLLAVTYLLILHGFNLADTPNWATALLLASRLLCLPVE